MRPLEDMELISDELKQFINTSFETVDHLRILLLLQASPERAWSLMAVSSNRHLRPEVAQKALDILWQKGFIAVDDSAERRYRYRPVSVELARLLNAVVDLDRTRPVTLIKLVYRLA
jgi:hypothetical protein